MTKMSAHAPSPSNPQKCALDLSKSDSALPDSHLVFRPSPPDQLPSVPEVIVGRDVEWSRMDEYLAASEAGVGPTVVVLYGPAGVGKTALAVSWLDSVRGRFGGGQLYAHLGCGSPGVVRQRWLRDLGVPASCVPVGGEGLDEEWRVATSRRGGLMMLIEEPSSSADVRALLPQCGLVVVTSQRQLADLPALHLRLKPLPAGAASELFHRLCDAPPEGGAADLVARCEGVPLAIRALAGRAVGASVDSSLVDAMVAEFDRYGPADGDWPPALNLAYAGATRAEARVYRLMGLHEGPDFSVALAAAAAGGTEDETFVFLLGLAAVGLVESAGGGRWRLSHPAQLHAQAMVKNEPAEVRATAPLDMAAFYRDAAAAARAAVFGEEPLIAAAGAAIPVFGSAAEALCWLEAEHLCLVAAARWAHRRGYNVHAYLIVHGMAPLYAYLRPADWVSTASLGLAAARHLDDQRAAGNMLELLAGAHHHRGDLDEALLYYRQAEAVWSFLDDPSRWAESRRYQGQVFIAQRRCVDAVDAFYEAYLSHAQRGERRSHALALVGLGLAYISGGMTKAAPDVLREAVEIFDSLPRPDLYHQARAHIAWGMALTDLGEIEAARSHLDRALAQMKEFGSARGQAVALFALAAWARRCDNPAVAAEFTRRGDALRRGESGNSIPPAAR